MRLNKRKIRISPQEFAGYVIKTLRSGDKLKMAELLEGLRQAKAESDKDESPCTMTGGSPEGMKWRSYLR